jgi:hypothetical protein
MMCEGHRQALVSRLFGCLDCLLGLADFFFASILLLSNAPFFCPTDSLSL